MLTEEEQILPSWYDDIFNFRKMIMLMICCMLALNVCNIFIL